MKEGYASMASLNDEIRRRRRATDAAWSKLMANRVAEPRVVDRLKDDFIEERLLHDLVAPELWR
jgi:hypothetical protein